MEKKTISNAKNIAILRKVYYQKNKNQYMKYKMIISMTINRIFNF